MTPGAYRAIIASMRLTPYQESVDGKTLHQTSDGDFRQVPDAEFLTPEERESVIKLIKQTLMITDQ